MVYMIPPISITNLNSVTEIEFSHHYIVCVPEQKSCDMRWYMTAIQIRILASDNCWIQLKNLITLLK